MRLRPYTTVLPKPLMPVGDRPILDVIIRQLTITGATWLLVVMTVVVVVQLFAGVIATFAVRAFAR